MYPAIGLVLLRWEVVAAQPTEPVVLVGHVSLHPRQQVPCHPYGLLLQRPLQLQIYHQFPALAVPQAFTFAVRIIQEDVVRLDAIVTRLHALHSQVQLCSIATASLSLFLQAVIFLQPQLMGAEVAQQDGSAARAPMVEVAVQVVSAVGQAALLRQVEARGLSWAR